MKLCIVCSSEFKPKSGNQKLCSDDCRAQHYGKSPETIRRDLDKTKTKVAAWRRRTKLRAVEYKGGKCKLCGYDRCVSALEFHHLDSDEKDFSISQSGSCRSWESIESELDKCVMLCSNCHKEIHSGVAELVAGA